MPDEQPQDAPGARPPAPERGAPVRHSHHPELPPFRLLEELKRRNVGRVAILYIVVSYVALQVFELFFHLLELPSWAGRVAVLVIAVGFPVALVFAWVYEITPEGLKLTEEVAPQHSIRHHTGKRLDRAIIAVLAIALTYFVVDKFWISKHAAPATVRTTAEVKATPVGAAVPEKSVAVLPFVDMSAKKDQEYFSDGLSEELIDHLARSADLKVIARTSSFQFKGKSEDMRTIGQRLGVATLLEGSVQKSGNTVRVTVQLIKVADGSHLWSQSYDRDMHDIFKVQDSITVAVVTALRATLGTSSPLSQEMPKNIEAYNAVLRSRYLIHKGTKENAEMAVAVLKEAIKLDPRYALPWVKLAWAYDSIGLQRWMSPKEAYAAARNALNHALAIDPNLAAAHWEIANLEWAYNWNFAASDAEEKRARELDRDFAPNFYGDGYNALRDGRVDEAIRLFQKVVERDPLDTWSLVPLHLGLQAAGRLPEAERVVRRLLELEPGFSGAHCALGQDLLAENHLEAALDVMSKEPDEGSRLYCLPQALWLLGRRAEANAMLAEAKKKYGSSMATSLAGTYAMRDDKDEAFQWLARAYDNHEPFFTLIKSNYSLGNLQSDPRWKNVLRKLGLPE